MRSTLSRTSPLSLVLWLGLPLMLLMPARGAGDRHRARSAQSPNDERDPAVNQRFDRRRAAAVEARHTAQLLAERGRQNHDPLSLALAAQILQQTPAPRPLVQARAAARKESPASGPLPAERSPESPSLALEPGPLLVEARALVRAQPPGSPMYSLLPVLDYIEQLEVVARGASLGPQRECDVLSPEVRMIYNILYEGGERAVLALTGDAHAVLGLRLSDEQGNVLHHGQDTTMIAWHPRSRAVFKVELENRSKERLRYCLETN